MAKTTTNTPTASNSSSNLNVAQYNSGSNLNVQQNNTPNNNLKVAQRNDGKYVIADQIKPNMTVEEKIKCLEEQSKLPGWTLEKQKELDDLKNSFKIENDKKLKKEKRIYDNKIEFKEEDILQYIFDKWILKGFSVASSELLNGVDYLIDTIGNGLSSGISTTYKEFRKGLKDSSNRAQQQQQQQQQQAQPTLPQPINGSRSSSAEQQPHTTRYQRVPHQEYIYQLDQTTRDFIHSNVEENQATGYRQIERLRGLKEGKELTNGDNNQLGASFKPPLSKQQQKKLDSYIKYVEHNYASVSTSMVLAAHLVRAKNAQKALGQEKPLTTSPSIYQKEVALMSLVIAKEISQSKDPNKFIENLKTSITNANKNITTSIAKGKHAGNGHTPAPNEELNKIYQQLGLNENGNLGTTKTMEIVNKPKEKATMLEALVYEQSVVAKTMESLKNINQNLAGIENDKQNNDKRRSNAQSRIAQIKAHNQACGVEYSIQTDKMARPNPNQPVYQLPKGFNPKSQGGRA